ncbi:MAG TPA: sigma-70 family RNA polymerase sigma factor [Burkholderiaceae bacterium]|nr:sigma-70 family RNA polymerase sigma factor [Burkholderiaceae bacterium]
MSGQDERITEIVAREGRRLRSFIRRRVADPGEAEDILQDVFYELIEATRLLQPIEQIGAWLFRVARNRIIDRFRKMQASAVQTGADPALEQDEELGLEQLLPSAGAGPEALFARRVLLEELESALDELPAVQREVFLAHELEGKSFREMAQESGLSVNTLLARKHYAVLHLRKRLQDIYEQINEANG